MIKREPTPPKLLGHATMAISYALAVMLVLPILRVLFGAFGGWIVQITVGSWVVKGAALFGLVIPADGIWALGAFLGFAGAYFQPPAVKKEAQAWS